MSSSFYGDVNLYSEWADFLHDMACGGHDCKEEIPRREVKLGDRYRVFWCLEYYETWTIDESNKAWVERNMNSSENDCWSFEKVEEA